MRSSQAWAILEPAISPLLNREDDPALWMAAVSQVYSDAELLAAGLAGSTNLVTEYGRCAHWLRPHQSRWTADGGFAWPTGYDGLGYSHLGLPEFDWSIHAIWDVAEARWIVTVGPQASRGFSFRVAIPSRTARHRQAAVHTVWRPGPPQHSRKELLQFYGFRNRDGGWEATAYMARPDEKAYESSGGGRITTSCS